MCDQSVTAPCWSNMASRRCSCLPAAAVVAVAVVAAAMVVVVEAAEEDEVGGKTVRIPNIPNFPNLVIDRGPLFGLFGNVEEEVKVVTCGETSEAAQTVWQSYQYPEWQADIAGLCTLTYTPPENSCGLRIHFVDLYMGSPLPSHHSSCSHSAPSFKVHYNGAVTPAICSDVTGYEAIVDLDPEVSQPLGFVLQLDTETDYKFRVNLTAVVCSDLHAYQSPNTCGIKNSQAILEAGYETVRNIYTNKEEEEVVKEEDQVEGEGEEEEEEEEKVKRRVKKKEEEEEEKSYRQEKGMWDEDLEEEDEEEEEVESQREPRRRRKNNRKKEAMVKKLRKKTDVLSQALASGIEAGIVGLTNDERLRRQPWRESVPSIWPWMVSIERKVLRNVGISDKLQVDRSASQWCTGVLLDHYHVLTAASCVLPSDRNNMVRVKDLKVLVGQDQTSSSSSSASRRSGSQQHQSTNGLGVSRVSFPLQYNPDLRSDNLAVLALEHPISYSTTARPVCLPAQYNRFPRNNGFVSGYVKESESKSRENQRSSSRTLVETDLNVLSRSECSDRLSNLPYRSQRLQETMARQRLVCTRGIRTRNAPLCQLETGALLIRRDRGQLHYLAGVMGGEEQCGVDFPNVFSEVPLSSAFLNLALAPRT
ncbi:uncharacterized protein LOC123517924 [Portunus trituberculatus]|uniref:uncharacterized protein LOC123517924 n=1 Tax=Portunus trituberculatus TaxID=210409 RepID=UPI001E1D21DE|nr:uncharacterized protein LOC123517924 [Portunus trituberculatus]